MPGFRNLTGVAAVVLGAVSTRLIEHVSTPGDPHRPGAPRENYELNRESIVGDFWLGQGVGGDGLPAQRRQVSLSGPALLGSGSPCRAVDTRAALEWRLPGTTPLGKSGLSRYRD